MSLTDLYLAILYPAALGKDVCFNIFTKPSRAYRQNNGLDNNQDGVVTVNDIDQLMRRLFPTASQIDKQGVYHGSRRNEGMILLRQEVDRFLNEVLPALLQVEPRTQF